MPEKVSWMDTNLALSEYFLCRSFGHSRLVRVVQDFSRTVLSVGSELDRKVKEAAADGEEAWDGIGEESGLFVWRVENFRIQPWPRERYGKLIIGVKQILVQDYGL